jgi:hypothetical protein
VVRWSGRGPSSGSSSVMEEGSTSAAQPHAGEAEPVVSTSDVGMERLVALMGKLTTEQFEAFASALKEGKLALTEVEGELKPAVTQTSGEQSSQPPSRYDNFVMSTLGTRDPNDPTSVNSGKVEIASILEEDGTNIDLWDRDVIAAVNAKGKRWSFSTTCPAQRQMERCSECCARASVSGWLRALRVWSEPIRSTPTSSRSTQVDPTGRSTRPGYRSSTTRRCCPLRNIATSFSARRC